MKKSIFLLIITVLLCSFNEPETIKWYPLNEGMELSRSTNKPILLFVYASWCDKCQRLEKKVFNNKEISPLISENFIPVKINPEVDTTYFHNDKTLNRKIFLNEVSPGRLAVMVPTTVFYLQAEHDTLVMRGLMDTEDFKENIRNFLKK